MRELDCSCCESAIDHCHGTLVVHSTRRTECTEEGCVDLDYARHTFVVDCGDVAGGCPCAEPDVARRHA
ncbi:hypothetical protein ACIBCD_11625 [Nocardia brasiliensis]|uniref:hypothetical protein n=1 Tax=Nocardia brasiliensis TaxID=37326 RepID=UPI0024578ACC|nr:hypothetical protein [Nocardia brasiliensis]